MVNKWCSFSRTKSRTPFLTRAVTRQQGHRQRRALAAAAGTSSSATAAPTRSKTGAALRPLHPGPVVAEGITSNRPARWQPGRIGSDVGARVAGLSNDLGQATWIPDQR
ncbi:hypothetical protein ABT369_49985 [Dactylosporangium sp. NPDC000244]|uniref:hypothetical protein n=1 Tax=Dactylosporangium sp. NPDC000244 TaxID=3154365 RepID=UPI0033178C80